MQIFSDRNLTKIRQGHKAVIARTKTALAEASNEAGEAGVDYVKRHPTFKPRTGNLQAKTDYRTVRIAGGRLVKLRNSAKYAKAIDGGAKPHMIAARKKRSLSFMWKGVRVFRRYVMHPGNRPYRFLYRATGAAGRVLARSLSVKMLRIAKQF